MDGDANFHLVLCGFLVLIFQLENIVLARIVVLLLSLAAVSAPETARAESVLRVKVSAELASLDPRVDNDFNSRNVINVLLEGLVAYREDASIGLMLAESLEVSPDGLRYLFTLREGVTFHNGAPLDAEAVVFAWRHYLNPAGRWRCLPQFDGSVGPRIVSVSAPELRRVLFELEKPNPVLLDQMARLECASAGVFHKESLAADGKWIRPIGTGPFKLGEAMRGQRLDLDKFAEYRSRPGPRDGMTGGKTPLVDKVRLLNLPIEKIPAALFGGQLDLDPESSIFSVELFQNHEDFVLNVHSTFELNGLLFQTLDPALSDPRMRRAILLALDREALARQVNYGRIGTVHSAIPSTSPYSGDLQKTPLPYDPAEAKRLLSEIGYAGQPITMLASKRYMTVYLAAVLAQDMIRKIGVNVELEEAPWEQLFERYAKGAYQLMMFPYSARIDPVLSFEMLTGDKAIKPNKVWDDPLAIELVQRAMKSFDPAERRSLLDQLHQRFVVDLPMIPMWNSYSLTLHHKKVKGYQPWAAGTPRYWGVWLE